MIQPGKHYFSGIDTISVNDEHHYLFILDDVTYEATENPCDGYRSWATIVETDKKCRFTFPSQEVILIENQDSENNEKDYVKMYDAQNGKLILRIETDYFDSYYPCAIFEYHPENMKINENK